MEKENFDISKCHTGTPAYGGSFIPSHRRNDETKMRHDQIGGIGGTTGQQNKAGEQKTETGDDMRTDKTNIIITAIGLIVTVLLAVISWQISVVLDSNKNSATTATVSTVVIPELQRQITEIKSDVSRLPSIERVMATKSDIAELKKEMASKTDIVGATAKLATKDDVTNITKLLIDIQRDVGKLQGRQEAKDSRKK